MTDQNHDEVDAVYLAVAYRYGWINNSSYFVWGGACEETATAFAFQEARLRGGKYGVAVWRIQGETHHLVHYEPSSYDESRPHVNQRIELFERIGNRIVGLYERGADQIPSPSKIGEIIERERRFQQAIESIVPEEAETTDHTQTGH